MKVSIASDHAGFDEKQLLIPYLQELGYEVIDRGPESADRVDYPDYAALVAKDVEDDEAERGVLICGTGIGMSIAANKHRGIRAACVSDTFSARLTRCHNNANVICFGARVIGAGLAADIVNCFIDTEYEGGRHARRVAMLDALDGD